MKFAFAVAMLAAVDAKKCDAELLSYEMYNDAKCTDLNEKLTGDMVVSPSEAAIFDQKCQTKNGKGKWGYTFYCDAKGLHEKVWDNQKCEGKIVTTINMPWNECSPVPGRDDMWLKVYTKQEFKGCKGKCNCKGCQGKQ